MSSDCLAFGRLMGVCGSFFVSASGPSTRGSFFVATGRPINQADRDAKVVQMLTELHVRCGLTNAQLNTLSLQLVSYVARGEKYIKFDRFVEIAKAIGARLVLSLLLSPLSLLTSPLPRLPLPSSPLLSPLCPLLSLPPSPLLPLSVPSSRCLPPPPPTQQLWSVLT